MNKIIISAALVSTLSITNVSATQNDLTFLFGTEPADTAVISSTEMQQTEGQLFGITAELVGQYIAVAANVLSPKLQAISKNIVEGVVDGITVSISNSALNRDPNGSITASLVGQGLTEGVLASLGGTFSLSNLFPTGSSLLNGATNALGDGTETLIDGTENTISNLGNTISNLFGGLF